MREPSPATCTAVPQGPDVGVQAAAAGDRSAWDRLVDVHASKVWGAALEAGFTMREAATVCRLAWLHVAQVLPRYQLVGGVENLLLDIVDREARLRDARLRRMGSASTPAIPAQAGLTECA